MKNNFSIMFPEGFDERMAFEATAKGWLSLTIVLNKREYSLVFYDITRLQQEAEESFAQGEPCFAEDNLIVLPVVSVEAIEKSVRYLVNAGYFDNK